MQPLPPEHATEEPTGTSALPSGAETPAATAPPTSEMPVSSSVIVARLDVLDDLAARPLSEHAEAYQQLHAELQQALADIDSAESSSSVSE